MFALLTPPFQIPDELDHYLYARMLTEGQALPVQLPGGGAGGAVRAGDLALFKTFANLPFRYEEKVSAQAFQGANIIREGASIQNDFSGAAIYPPTAYAVPALGLAVADAMGASRLVAFYGGRAANALAFVGMATIALCVLPVSKGAFAFVLLLPMTLSQAGSFSADAHVFGVTAIICALLARESLCAPRALVLTVVAAMILMVALTKAPMVALLLPLAALSWRHSKALAAVLTIGVLAAFAVWTLEFVLTEAQAARSARLGNVSATDQLDFLLSSPFSVFTVAWGTLTANLTFYYQSMVGRFGWLDAPMALWFYWLAGLSFAVTAGASALETKALPHGLAFALSAIVSATLTFGALYLSWTPVGAGIVVGVQGRYFIPVLLPAVIALAGLARMPINPLFAFTPAVLLWGAAAVHAPLVLVFRYYLR